MCSRFSFWEGRTPCPAAGCAEDRHLPLAAPEWGLLLQRASWPKVTRSRSTGGDAGAKAGHIVAPRRGPFHSALSPVLPGGLAEVAIITVSLLPLSTLPQVLISLQH